MPLEKRNSIIDDITGISAFNDPSIFRAIKDIVINFFRIFYESIKEVIKGAMQNIKGLR